MARTSVNVIGNCLATCVIAKWEGEFGLPPEENLELIEAEAVIVHELPHSVKN